MSRGRISQARFRELVAEALDALPEIWARRLDNVAVVVEEEPSLEELESVGMSADENDELLGLYQGVPLGERGWEYAALPDRIVVFRGPILRLAGSREEVIRMVQETVLHELGHHFGLDEDDLPF